MSGLDDLRAYAEDWAGLRRAVESVEADLRAAQAVADERYPAGEWVERNGGLEKVKWLLDWCLSHDSKIEQLDFDFWLSGRVMRDLGFEGDLADRDEVERRLRARLMPEGHEWPRDARGVPVVRGETVWANGSHRGDGRAWHVRRVSPGSGYPVEAEDSKGVKRDLKPGWLTHERPAPKVLDSEGIECNVGDDVWWVRNKTGNFHITRIESDGKCAIRDDDADAPCGMTVPSSELTHKRPVLDADGAEIRVGDDLYGCESGRGPFKVAEILSGSAEVRLKSYLDGGEFTTCAATFTHRAPVLAADGKPLREGETVWSTETGSKYTVREITGGLVPIKCDDECGLPISLHQSRLTHERPDSWERLEGDAELPPLAYVQQVGNSVLDDRGNALFMTRDIVRRAKALAGVER